jgi:hypothetical protein
MGRGLSELQINILRLAYQKRQEHMSPEAVAKRREERKSLIFMAAYAGVDVRKEIGDEPSDTIDLYYAEIYKELFGFRPIYKYADMQESGKHFDPSSIGNYNSVMASVSRSVKRLWKRDLIVWIPATRTDHYAFLLLTDKGIEYLKAIGYASGEVNNGITDRKENSPPFFKDGMGTALSSGKE